MQLLRGFLLAMLFCLLSRMAVEELCWAQSQNIWETWRLLHLEIEPDGNSEFSLREAEVCFLDGQNIAARLARKGEEIFVNLGSTDNVVSVEVLRSFGLSRGMYVLAAKSRGVYVFAARILKIELVQHCKSCLEDVSTVLDVEGDEDAVEQTPVEAIPIPVMPPGTDVSLHEMTHLPHQAWCSVCVQSRGRDSCHHATLTGEDRQGVPLEGQPPIVELDHTVICGHDCLVSV